MDASIEWMCDCPIRTGLLRVHPDGGGYGSPYTFACVVTQIEEGFAEVHLAIRAPTPTEFRAVATALKAAGYSRARWERRNSALARVTHFKRRETDT